MTPFEAYRLLLALRLHFTSPDYDFFKYKGQVTAKQEKFDRHRDRFVFIKLARKYNDPIAFTNLIVANFVAGKLKESARYFLTGEAEEIAARWEKNLKGLPEIVYAESCLVRRIAGDVAKILEPIEGGHPLLLSLFYADTISLETLIVYDRLFHFSEKWNASMIDDVMWPETERMMRRYSPFLVFNHELLRRSIKKALKE